MTAGERQAIGAKLMACRDYVYLALLDFGVRHEDAPDVVQDVFLAAVRRWGDYSPEQDLQGWLHGICRKVASNVRRTRRRRPAELWDTPPLVTVVSHEARIEARDVLATLPEHLEPLCRALADNGYRVAPTARELGVDDESIRVRLVAIRKGADVAPLTPRPKHREK